MAANRDHSSLASLSRRILLALALALVAAGTAQANPTQPSSPGTSATSAKATIGFRIVVREALGLGMQGKRLAPSAPQLSRVTSHEAGRQVLTLAQP